MVKCSNKECEIVVRFRELASHLSNSCGFRPAYCEYRIAGCKWEGTANRVDGHKKRSRRRAKFQWYSWVEWITSYNCSVFLSSISFLTSCIIGSHPSISTIMQHIQLKQEQFESQKKLIKQQTAIQGQVSIQKTVRERYIQIEINAECYLESFVLMVSFLFDLYPLAALQDALQTMS